MATHNPIDVNGCESAQTYERVSLAGGVLVYERQELGRQLVGFEDVTDWDELQDGLAARGHGRGAIFNLPELDRSD